MPLNHGAPDEVRELLDHLIAELRGCYEAEGWAAPQAEIEFIIGRLDHYISELRDYVDALF